MSNALANSIITSPAIIPEQRLKDLAPLVGKYLS
jgi:hypothetical protein